jgi:hypothetical protein
MIFRFSTRARRQSLFLTSPRDEGVAKEDAITSSGKMRIRIPQSASK